MNVFALYLRQLSVSMRRRRTRPALSALSSPLLKSCFDQTGWTATATTRIANASKRCEKDHRHGLGGDEKQTGRHTGSRLSRCSGPDQQAHRMPRLWPATCTK
jgi:hypothetical protein